MENLKEYDLIIIGGGCAGYPCAIYSSRFNLKTLVISKELGGLIATTDIVENYPGFDSISGPDLALKFENQVKYNNVEIENDNVSKVSKNDNKFLVETNFLENKYIAKSILIATGSHHRKLNVKGEKEFTGFGVSYCATCDGGLYKNKIVGVVGGSDSAVREAMILANLCKKVYLFVRSYLKAEPANIKKLENFSNICIITKVNILEILGDKFLNSVKLDKKTDFGEKINLDGLFIAIGHLPQNQIAKSLGVNLNSKGEIITGKFGETNILGVFAAGDVTDIEWKQAITSAAQGSMAAYKIYNYLNQNSK